MRRPLLPSSRMLSDAFVLHLSAIKPRYLKCHVLLHCFVQMSFVQVFLGGDTVTNSLNVAKTKWDMAVTCVSWSVLYWIRLSPQQRVTGVADRLRR